MTKPLVGELRTPRVPHGPYEVGQPNLSGTLTFPCCSETWEVSDSRITHVQCPDCGNLYTLTLKFSINPSEPQKFPKGTMMEVITPFTLKVGASPHTTKVGDKLRVGMDAYGLFAIPEGGIILEFPSVGNVTSRILLAAAPLSHLRPVEAIHVKINPERNDQNSHEDR